MNQMHYAQPLIGVTTAQPTEAAMGRLFNGTSRLYAEAIAHVGAVPLLLPTIPEMAEAYALHVDAVLFTGGVDVHPRMYGEHPRPGLGVTDDERDDFEAILYRAVRRQGKPVFGICRGVQFINVMEGGTLHQHLPDSPAIWIDHVQKAPPPGLGHLIHLEPGSLLGKHYGPTSFINSYHHQAIDLLSPALHAVALAPDGLVEAVEGNNTVAVQWHPELMLPAHAGALKVFHAFMDLL